MMRWSRTRARARCDENSRSAKLVGKNAVPEQVGAFLEGRLLGQFVDVDAAIREHTGISIDPADGGVGSDDSFQTFSRNSSRHRLLELPLYDDLDELVQCGAEKRPLNKGWRPIRSKDVYNAAIRRLSRRVDAGSVSV